MIGYTIPYAVLRIVLAIFGLAMLLVMKMSGGVTPQAVLRQFLARHSLLRPSHDLPCQYLYRLPAEPRGGTVGMRSAPSSI